MSGVLCQCSTTGVRLGTGDLGIPTFLTTLLYHFTTTKWKIHFSSNSSNAILTPREKNYWPNYTLPQHQVYGSIRTKRIITKEKKKRNEVFTFQHLRYITSCIVAPHARLVSVFISFTTRWLPGRPKLRYFQFSILIYNAMSACLSVNFELLSNFTPNNLHLE